MTAAFKGRIALSAFLALTLGACALPSPGVVKASPSAPVIASPTPPTITPPTNLVRPGTITFLSDTTFPPQESMDTNNQAIGFDIDIAQALAAKMGLTATIQKTDSPLLVGALLAKKGDAIISALQVTPDLQRQVALVAYFRAGQAILAAAFVATAVLGLVMAVRIARPVWPVWLVLAAGILLPLLLALTVGPKSEAGAHAPPGPAAPPH